MAELARQVAGAADGDAAMRALAQQLETVQAAVSRLETHDRRQDARLEILENRVAKHEQKIKIIDDLLLELDIVSHDVADRGAPA